MKKILVILLLLSFVSRAQYDTAWVGDDYLEQYIFPPLIHNSLERQTMPPQGLVLAYNGVHLSQLYNISPFDYVEEVAQRYEVAANDSVRIMGVALYSYFNPIHNPAREVDYITVSILNSDLTETLYSQTFASGSAGDPNFDFISYINTPGGHNGFFYPFVECIFDDTITLYGDYFVAFKHHGLCSAWIYNSDVYCTDLAYMHLTTPSGETTSLSNYVMYIPPGYNTKYKPFVKTCLSHRNWTYFDQLNWPTCDLAKYPGSNWDQVNDTSIYMALGICPIKALNNSSSDSLDSGVVSVELLEENIEIYPNPAKDVLNINSAFAIKEVEIYDALNRLIEKRKANNKNIQLNIANLKAGTYLVKINTAKGEVKKKLIVE